MLSRRTLIAATVVVIAIPALMFYRYFRGLVDAYTLDLEQAADRLIPHLLRFAVPRQAAA